LYYLRLNLAGGLALLEYCTLNEVKSVLQLEIEETTHDTELSSCVASASALLDALLKVEGLTVPSVVPQLIVDASKFLVAWDFRRRRDPVGAVAFMEEANKILGAYIQGEKETYVGSV